MRNHQIETPGTIGQVETPEPLRRIHNHIFPGREVEGHRIPRHSQGFTFCGKSPNRNPKLIIPSQQTRRHLNFRLPSGS